MNYTETLDFLFSSLTSFQEKGAQAYKPGLERITEFCKHIGNPQRNFFTIHVAGTNGKGSVSHIIASVLEQAGYCTGLFTSPHLKDFRERIKVNGEAIPKQKVVNFINKNYAKMVELDLSFFEVTTALAFEHFTHSDVEVAIIETGLGGRLDATNVIIPMVSIITNIGLEHTSLLGDTIQEIAAEKGGIIKKSIPVIIGESNKEYNGVFEDIATKNRSKIVYAEDMYRCLEHAQSSNGRSMKMQRIEDKMMFDIDVDLAGEYQCKNVTTAISTINFLHNETPLSISRRALLEGMRNAAKDTSFHGRWEKIGESPLIICDTAHNIDGIASIAEQLKGAEYRELYCILGFTIDKEVDKILALLPQNAHYIFTQTLSERCMVAEDIAKKAKKLGLIYEVEPDVKKALEMAKERTSDEDMIFVGGSTYIVAEVL